MTFGYLSDWARIPLAAFFFEGFSRLELWSLADWTPKKTQRSARKFQEEVRQEKYVEVP